MRETAFAGIHVRPVLTGITPRRTLGTERGYGSLVIEPDIANTKTDRELVVLISDWTDEDPYRVLRTLKSRRDYYSLKKGFVENLS